MREACTLRRMTKLFVPFAALLLAASCGPKQPAPNPEPVETAAPPPAETSEPTTAETAAPAETAVPAPAKPTKEELEKVMTPPAGAPDVRPVLGTDPDVVLPAMFANVKKGMTAKELDAIFPGVGAVPKIAFVNFTKQGNKWVRVKGNQKHKDLLDIAYDDAGGLTKIAYMFDPAAVKPDFWDYLKKSAIAKWGKTSDSDLLSWQPAGMKTLTVHKSGDTTFSVGVEL